MNRAHRSAWRRHLRLIPAAERPVVAEWIDSLDHVELADISEGGAELLIAGPAPAGERLRLRVLLPLPIATRLELSVRVCHVEAGRLGVAFDDLSSAQRAQLERYLACERHESSLRTRLRRWYRQLWDGPRAAGTRVSNHGSGSAARGGVA